MQEEDKRLGIGGNNPPIDPASTLEYEPWNSEHILACARVPLEKVIKNILRAGKGKWIEYIKARAKFDCCRDINNLEVEAYYSRELEKEKKTPDVYKFHCKVCKGLRVEGEDRGGTHVMFCVGGSHPTDASKKDIRPYWDIR